MLHAHEPLPILVVDRFPALLDALVDLLSGLSPAEWEMPTVCAGWSVKDVALHLLGDEVGNLSRRRDGHTPPGRSIADWLDLVAYLNELNEQWVRATRRISPRLLCDLLRFTGMQAYEYFRSLDPYVIGGPVSWAGPAPAPVWLDVAREYTERWHHQQQICDAVGKPGLTDPEYLAPVLDTFVRALPHTYRDVAAADGTCVALDIAGDAGGSWFVRREGGAWKLYAGRPPAPDATVVLPQDVAWRLFSKAIPQQEAFATATLAGDRALGLKALEMVSVIA